MLDIDVLKPLSSVLVKPITSDDVPQDAIVQHCKLFGDLDNIDKSKGSYVVTFNTRKSKPFNCFNVWLIVYML